MDQGGDGIFVTLRKYLSSKGKSKSKSSVKTTSPPRSTAPNSDLYARFASQLITVNRKINDKICAMSSSLVSQFSDMLDEFRVGLTNPSFSVDP